ncbi:MULTISPECIES: IclR family transcriptional regulator [unclassified Brevibacterium]|uniref:IclR family transcriptional regulator n=1 Tax=unclassified Brevibacterium TaxID=2614124 RepID=UPI001E5C6427|nr:MULTISPECIES: IclR family transcriptional regulator [unclassified Brevibacterium]MCD1287387.1 IclR family transcriptional regulator [Brevibacterium sp. CCUG 69071]MDK8436817.1 IclR family transcriptional regulator [Brevibacterium sp. H-BE7]
MANSQSGDSMIDRLVRVLGSFDPEHPSLSTEEIADRAQLPKSTAYRLISDMTRHDLLQRDPSGRIRIGVGMWELSNRASDAVDLASVARPHMTAVHDFVGENTQLGILREREVLIIERMSKPSAVIHRSKTAGRLPAHASSCGLVLLAHAPKHVREAYLRGPLAAITERTTTDPTELRRMLATIRTYHFAELVGHIDDGTTGIAVPVFDGSGLTIAGLGVVVDSEHHVGVPAIMQALRTASAGITRDLEAQGRTVV